MKKLISLSLGLVLSGLVNAQSITLEAVKQMQPQKETLEIISTLASDEFMGRSSRTEGYKAATLYVENYLKSNGIQPYFKEGYRDTVRIGNSVASNIVGLIGKHSKKKDYVLIGAHLDHLGMAENALDSIYNGANDNASGSTAVLQVAKVLNTYQFDQNIIIALFAEEERGLVGAKQLAKRLKDEGINLSYMINFEMIGKTLSTGPNRVYITGYKKSNFAEQMNRIAAYDFIEFLPTAESYNLFKRSDNFPFYTTFGVPSHTISTFDFENYTHYHQTSDEVEQLDIENMNAVTNTATLLIGKLLESKTVLKNIKETAEEKD